MRATYIGCIGTHAHGSQVTSLLCLSDVIMWNWILAYLVTSGSLFKKKNSGEQLRKRIHYLCDGRIEKSVPRIHRLSSLGNQSLVMTNGNHLDRFFYHTLTLMIDPYSVEGVGCLFCTIMCLTSIFLNLFFCFSFQAKITDWLWPQLELSTASHINDILPRKKATPENHRELFFMENINMSPSMEYWFLISCS